MLAEVHVTTVCINIMTEVAFLFREQTSLSGGAVVTSEVFLIELSPVALGHPKGRVIKKRVGHSTRSITF